MGCPFCRQQMQTLVRDAWRIRGLGVEILQVTPTPIDRARLYARRFALPFPYLCDPDHYVHRAWGLGARGHSTRDFLRRPPPPSGGGVFSPVVATPGELLATIRDDDAGVFVVDRAGIVRYAQSGSYYRRDGYHPPSYDELRRLLSGPEER
jgi:hypothetical protein